MDTLTAYKEHLTEMRKLYSAQALLGWDLHAHMPKKAAPFRSQVIAKLATMAFELAVSDELGGFIEELEKNDDLSEIEKRSIRHVARDYRRHKAVPPEFVKEVSEARSSAQSTWTQAKAASDFASFKPYLEKNVELARRYADYLGFEDHPYDALLEDFEPGMTCEQLSGIIEPLKEDLVPFLAKLMESGTHPDPSPLKGSFDLDAQRKLARRSLEIILYDFDAGGLTDVTHPFTTTIGPGDIRVTNRYAEDHLGPGLFAALHEGGHALYNQGFSNDLYALGVAGGASNGIHESQSRMIENQIGRSLPFWQGFQPVLAEYFPQFAQTSPELLHGAANIVAPSLIRVEADEVTYNFHIMLRFELEAGLIDGSIAVADLPTLWNEAMDRYLGVAPPDDGQGVLQDIHWSMGAFGYFPSYMLGNLYAAQMLKALRTALPGLDDQIRKLEFEPLLGWLRENVHQHGGLYLPTELMERITGAPLDGTHFVEYVTTKYSELYKL